MTTLQIETDDRGTIKNIKNLIAQNFHIHVKVIQDTTTDEQKPKTKWAEFAEKMDGLFTPDIVEHIKHSRKKARENFIPDV